MVKLCMKRRRLPLMALLALLALIVGVIGFAIPPAPPRASAAEPDDAAPMLVLVEYDPWVRRIGPANPQFALYDDGLLIFSQQPDGGQRQLYTVTLDADELSEFYAAFGIDQSFFALKAFYLLPIREQQPNNVIYVKDATLGVKWVGVYGNLREEGQARELAPEAFVRLFDQIAIYVNEDAEVWVPDQFEVVLSPLAPGQAKNAVAWPAGWPGLSAPTTIRRGNSFSIYLPRDQRKALMALIKDADAIEVDGQVFKFNSRLPFPHEETWQTATEKTSFAIGY